MAEIAILRALQNHFRRLHIAKSIIQGGKNTEEAMKNLKPPVFFKQKNSFQSQLNRWSLRKLDKVLNKLSELEAQTKTSSMPVKTLCAQAVLSISAIK